MSEIDFTAMTPPLTAPGVFANLPKPRAILFDWDNSLVETWPSIIAALNATLAEMGHPIWSESEAKLKIRASLRDAFPAMFGARWEIARDIYYREFTRTHLATLVAKPNADELLQYLSQNNGAEIARDPLFLGVVSNKQGKYLRAECTALNWDGYFQALVGPMMPCATSPIPPSLIMFCKAARFCRVQMSGWWAIPPWICTVLGLRAARRFWSATPMTAKISANAHRPGIVLIWRNCNKE